MEQIAAFSSQAPVRQLRLITGALDVVCRPYQNL
jgi:hypothetical protein